MPFAMRVDLGSRQPTPFPSNRRREERQFAEHATHGDTRRSDDARLVALATERMAALTRLENLPPVGGAIGRAVDVLTHVDRNTLDDHHCNGRRHPGVP